MSDSDPPSPTDSEDALVPHFMPNHRICGDPSCTRHGCLEALHVPVFVYLPVHHSPYPGPAICLTPFQERRNPIVWKGRMVRGAFRFLMDHTLAHLTMADRLQFRLYRPWGGGWLVVRLADEVAVAPGDFLIYREINLSDDQCRRIGCLINALHDALAFASPYEFPVQAPERYEDLRDL